MELGKSFQHLVNFRCIVLMNFVPCIGGGGGYTFLHYTFAFFVYGTLNHTLLH